MRAILRTATVLMAAGFGFASTGVLGQTAPAPAPAPTTNTPATDTIGPSELKDFNLKGTVTRPADPQAEPTPSRPQPRATRPPVPTAQSSGPQPPALKRATPTTIAPPPLRAAPATTSATRAAPPISQTVNPAPVESAPSPLVTTPQAVSAAVSPPGVPAPPPGDPFAAFRGLPLWPWIVAALSLLAGAAFLLWRRWPRELAVAGPQFDLLVPAQPDPEPQPQPQPQPRPMPRAASPASPPAAPSPAPVPRPATANGIVASRLRPALELGFQPLRCQVDDDQVTIEFELELFNAGTAPARAVLAEASMLNASATQERDLAAFFGNPNGVGERLSVIPPMKRVSFRSQVVAPRAAVREYELAGRKAFVPVIAFNALYEWSGGKGQSSAAYLVGRDTQKEKLGPLRLDKGTRDYRGLGARPLPSAVRT